MQAVESQKAPVDLPRELNSANAAKIVKARLDDFERVYPLLQSFGISRITKDDWRRLFTTNWDSPESHCGYLLEDNGEVKGFLGLLFSQRRIQGGLENFCNMTSWMVKQESRAQSLQLLLEALKHKDYTITNFTPSTGVARILQKLGFTELKTSHQILLPVPDVFSERTTHRCIFDHEEISRRLNAIDRKIFDDHQGFNCRHVLITAGDEYCYLVVKNRQYKHLPFARVHYLSNRELFAASIDSIRTSLCWRLKVAGLMIDNRYIDGSAFAYSRSYAQQCPAFFKSSTLSASNIDTLYSEMILLHN